ncbi:MAG: glycosyltransferase family 2 protein [Kiritimatiellales bacterium]|nr:glycosyltransferase family 2 protein [Kiritimatiellales bacterium]
MMTPNITLLLPVYNDGPRIIPVINTLFQTVERPLKIIAIYDQPTDPTKLVLEKLQGRYSELQVVQNDWDRGGLNAIKTGLRHVDTEYVGIWVSYHIDPFGALNAMLEKMDEGYDLVSANRFAAKVKQGRGGFIKRMASLMGNLCLKAMVKLPINDISTSVKLFRKQKLDEIQIETEGVFGWAVLVEWTVKMACKGYRIGEVPFGPENLNMLYSTSNFNLVPQLKSYWRWLRYAWENRSVIRANYSESN